MHDTKMQSYSFTYLYCLLQSGFSFYCILFCTYSFFNQEVVLCFWFHSSRVFTDAAFERLLVFSSDVIYVVR